MARDDEIVIDVADINHEANTNMWCFSPSDEEMQGITAESVEAFIEKIIQARRERLQGKAMLFYCWHDFQARQLRFSLVSKAHGRLPFGCVIEETSELSRVVDSVVNRDWLNKQYFEPPTDEAVSEMPFVLQVFVVDAP